MNALVLDLVRRWQIGWVKARGLAPANATGDALEVLVGQSGRYREIIALAPHKVESLRELARQVATASHANWLTIPTTDPKLALRVVREAGLTLHSDQEALMECSLGTHPYREAMDPYQCVAAVEDQVITVEVLHASGELAARGTMAVADRDGIADRIETFPEHRRRGLASIAMGVLTDQAWRLGAVTGILIASPAGQRLYSTLGWQHRATVIIACTPNIAA